MLPDTDSVSLVMVPAVDASLFVEVREEPAGTQQRTERQVVSAGTRVEFRLEGLRRDQAYTYRVLVKRAGDAGPHEPRRHHRFRTTREPGQTFSFAYATDAHTWNIFSQHLWGSMAQIPIAFLRQGLTNLAEDDLDFVVLGGDTTVTHLIGGVGGAEAGIHYEPGSVTSGEQGILRYRRVFGSDLIGLPMASLPFVYVLGNHEAEVGFATPAGPCGFFDDTALASEIGRRTLFADPHEVYGGNPEGSYYAFESGDALVVVLDVLRYVPSLPTTANHWTLGPTQLAWLQDVLSESDATWTFVFAEHLVGGEKPLILNCYWYARGGLRATSNDLPTGVFKGEQKQVQALLEDTVDDGGAAFFLCGHDHVSITPTEKFHPDGTGTNVWYVKGGQLGASNPAWAADPNFQREMDWDVDGVPDYTTDTIGSMKRGYFRITVDGRQSVTFDYVQTNVNDPEVNGTTLYSRTILAR